MLEPNPPGKRPEKFMFNFALLWTDDGGEFNIAEARARSMGLLDKRWNPPPASESRLAPGNMPSTSESTGMHTTRTLKRKSIMGGGPEPTLRLEIAFGQGFWHTEIPEGQRDWLEWPR